MHLLTQVKYISTILKNKINLDGDKWGNYCLKVIKHSNFLLGIKKKIKDLTEAGPWLVKLYLADNGIDGKGKEGENGLLEFIHILTWWVENEEVLFVQLPKLSAWLKSWG